METHQERMSYSGDGALSRRVSSFDGTLSTIFANEFSAVRPPVCLGHSMALPPSPPFFQYTINYGREDHHYNQCPTPCLFTCSGLQQNRAMCFADMMPSLALHGLLPNINLDENNESLASAAWPCIPVWSSVAGSLPEVPKSDAIQTKTDGAEPVWAITSQEMEQAASPSVQPDHQNAFHNNEQQPNLKFTISSMAFSSVGQEQARKSKPKWALTAYNIFFKEQRRMILEDRWLLHADFHNNGSKLDKKMWNSPEHGHNKIGFQEMGKIIGQRWQGLDHNLRHGYDARAQADKRRYKEELAEYLLNERNEREAKFASLQASVSEDTRHRYFSTRK